MNTVPRRLFGLHMETAPARRKSEHMSVVAGGQAEWTPMVGLLRHYPSPWLETDFVELTRYLELSARGAACTNGPPTESIPECTTYRVTATFFGLHRWCFKTTSCGSHEAVEF